MRRHGGAARLRRAALIFTVFCLGLGANARAHAYRVEARERNTDPHTQSVRVRSLKGFVRCQKEHASADSDLCLDALKAYVKRNPRQAFAAGKLARAHYMHWVALDFFAQALEKRASKKECKDPDLRAAVLSGLALPAHYPAVQQAKQLAQGRCWQKLEPALVSDLRGTHGYYRDNLCPLLAEKNVSNHRCQRQAELRQHEADRSIEALAQVDASELPLDPEAADALRSARGEELMLARTKVGKREYVLLKFKAVKSPWNERVLVALEQKRAGGKDYVIAEEGRARLVLSERYGHYEAYPEGIGEGIWLTPWRATTEPVHLPTRGQIADEFAAVNPR